jgi:hypothetical protein
MRNPSKNILCSSRVQAQVHNKIVLNRFEPFLLPPEVELCPNVVAKNCCKTGGSIIPKLNSVPPSTTNTATLLRTLSYSAQPQSSFSKFLPTIMPACPPFTQPRCRSLNCPVGSWNSKLWPPPRDVRLNLIYANFVFFGVNGDTGDGSACAPRAAICQFSGMRDLRAETCAWYWPHPHMSRYIKTCVSYPGAGAPPEKLSPRS